MKPAQTSDRRVKPSPDREAARGHYAKYVRGSLFAVMVAGLVYMGFGFGRLFAQWRHASQPAASTTKTAFEHSPWSAALPLSGPWSFAGLDWNLASTVLSGADADTRLRVLADPPAAFTGHYPDVCEELLRIIDTLRLQPVEKSGFQLYTYEHRGLKAQLLARNVGGRMKAVTFAIVYPQSGQQFQMFELTPHRASSNSGGDDGHLLPLPAGATRLAGRFGGDSRLLLELLSLKSDTDSLVAAWKNAGWEVRPSGLGTSGTFSVLCRRGTDVIYAWSANQNGSLESLMLVRSPTEAELQVQPLTPNH
jgi:hypothetical protein